MFQITFSDQSIAELNKLDKFVQMEIAGGLSDISKEMLEKPNEDMGKFTRDGKTLHRLRIGDYRLYFERIEDTLHCHYIITKNTIADFVVRFKLPITKEILVEQDHNFWQYLDSLKK